MDRLYEGIFIPTHKIIDAESKEKAAKSLKNWEHGSITAEKWVKKLDLGETIQPSKFNPKDDGTYTHAKEYWVETHFVCADGDNIKGVEFLDDGSDKNPDGIEAWTKPGQLSKIYPGLLKRAYAVGESVSSMLAEPLHRRFRIIFIFEKPIKSEKHYHAVLLKLAEEFPIIPKVSRSPAQPVFGNGREDFNFHVCGNILELNEFPEPKDESQKHQNGKNGYQNGKNETLEEYLRRNGIQYQPTKDPNKFYVECPYKSEHTGGKQGPTDSYVFDDGTGWAYYCSHAHCRDKRTWEAFKAGHGIKNGEKSSKRKSKKKTETENQKSEKVGTIELADTFRTKDRYWYTQEVLHKYNPDTGIYEPAEPFLKWQSRVTLGESSSTTKVNEIVNHISDLSIDGETQSGICFQNGVLNLETLELAKHSPENYFLQSFPVEWNKKAECTRFVEWLKQVLPDMECQKAIFEMIGSFFDTNSNRLQTAFLLTGSGSNGKSLLLEIISILIGESNICRTPFSEYGKDRFAISSLLNKTAAIDDDVQPEEPLTSTIKPLITARYLQCEPKYKERFNFNLQATFCGAINGAPSTSDTSSAFWRRWCVIPFQQTFEKDAKFTKELIDEVSQPESLSGILLTALVVYKNVLETGQFTIPEISKETLDTMRLDANPVRLFVEESTEFDPDEQTTRKDLYAAYAEWCSINDHNKYGERRFFASIREYASQGVEEYRTTDKDRKTVRGFRGIKLYE